jgi:hypothetical protein
MDLEQSRAKLLRHDAIHIVGCIMRCAENLYRIVHRRDIENARQPGAVQHVAYELRRVHQFQLNRIVAGPAMQEDQHTQSSAIEHLDRGQIEYDYSRLLQARDGPFQKMKCFAAHDSAGALQHGHVTRLFAPDV